MGNSSISRCAERTVCAITIVGTVLKKAGLNCDDLVLVYCGLGRSIIEYAPPVWVVLPSYLEDLLESIQRKALRIILAR